jgi:hypothetical protein
MLNLPIFNKSYTKLNDVNICRVNSLNWYQNKKIDPLVDLFLARSYDLSTKLEQQYSSWCQ